MSRWTTEREWAWSSASQRSAPISPISRSLSVPSRLPVEGRAVDQLGDEQGAAVLLAHLVEGDDPGVVEARGGLGLAQDPPAAVVAAGVDRLDRDRALEAAVPGLVDDAEAAAADAALDQESVEYQGADQSTLRLRRVRRLLQNASLLRVLTFDRAEFILSAHPTSLESQFLEESAAPGRRAGAGRPAAPNASRSCCAGRLRSAPA